MRIHRIDIEGFGPFRDRQVVDLDRYADDGIFLISGRTGTGKSSILDAICFALYGSTPRYDDGEKRLRSDYSDGTDPSRVVLDFSIGEASWRVERTPQFERPKQRGEGTTTERSTVVLSRWNDDWEAVATKDREVGAQILEIVGMNGQQFQQVILLAQGRFARFLLAKNDERQRLLRSLFGTHRFEQYETELDARRKAAEQGLEKGTSGLRAILDEAARVVAEVREAAPSDDADLLSVEVAPDDWPARIAQVEAAGDVAGRRRAALAAAEADADRVRAAAEKVRDDTRVLAENQRRRDSARAKIADLDSRRSELDAAKAELDGARRADTVRSALAALERAETDAERITVAADRALEAWTRARDESGDVFTGAEPPAPDAVPADLDAFADEIARRIGSWEPLRVRETELARDADGIEARREELREIDESLTALAAREEALPHSIASARKRRDDASARAAKAESVSEHIRALEVQFAAAHDVEKLAAAYAAAEKELAAAKEKRQAAEHTLDELHRRRLAGFSSELAQQLVPGEPCAVCGSVDHPSPAPLGDDQVTPDAIDDADEQRTLAVAAHEAAAAARQQAELDLREAESRAGGRSATAVDGDLLVARGQKSDAEHAAGEVSALDKQIADLEAARDRAAAEHRAARESRVQLDTEIANAVQAHAAGSAAVAEARGPYESVALRIGAAQRLASQASARAEAARDAQHADATLRSAREGLTQALGEAGFDTADLARAAVRPKQTIDELATRVSEAETARAAAQETLTELAALRIPDEPVATAESEKRLAAARDAHVAAIEHRGEADRVVAALQAASERATAAHDVIREQTARAAVISGLANTIAGRAPNDRRMNLETFVLAAELEEIVQAANLRLSEMSDNRYTLRHTDGIAHRGAASGLGIEVFDSYSGRARPPHSLSGGETFLASLSLALGLAEVVTNRAGGIRLDTLFIDEGFGSLDAETLETAMRTLDDLRQGGRTVGLISHVEVMKEQIPAQLRVRRAPGGWSVVEQ
ncbi:MAG: AAA family ATPase [Microbacterium gubbeenense]|uniref:AAA family ATPase n=1 Tax=Microbacterium gubbeenense TaxID=159896 RepID=UPI003F95C0D8